MDRVITEIDQSAYLKGELLGDAIFKYGSAELIDTYNSAVINSQKSQSALKPTSLLDGLVMVTSALQTLNKLNNDHEKLLQTLKLEILALIRSGELIPLGFKQPRDISDKPIQIPVDLFFSGEVNWENSGLIYRSMEFSGIRILRALNSMVNLKSLKSDKSENSEIKKDGNSKLEKFNFSDLEDDRYIDEKLAAEFLGIAVKTLQGYRVKGGGPEFRKIGVKTVRYKFSDLKIWAESRKKKNTSQR